MMVEVPNPLFDLHSDQLGKGSLPDIVKADFGIFPQLEQGLQKLAFLVFNTEGSFYLRADQLSLPKVCRDAMRRHRTLRS